MKPNELETLMRQGEYFHNLRCLDDIWIVIRVDGRSFSKFTADRFEKPFDKRFHSLMVTTAEALLTEFAAVYAYTESDEISLLLSPQWDLFDREVEKLVSLSAGVASATFTLHSGEAAHFDSRIWLGADVGRVVDYFRWRQADATRCAINGWCYWTLRDEGLTARKATSLLEGLTVSQKNELLFERGINFNNVPCWQRRGVGLSWETFLKEGYNPVTEEEVQVERRRVKVQHELPMKQEYSDFIRNQCESALPALTTH